MSLQTQIVEHNKEKNIYIVKLEEWTTYTPEKYPELKDLLIPPDKYIRTFIELLKTRDQIIILELKTGLYIKTKYTVGTFQISNIEFVINPKIKRFEFLQLMSYVLDLARIDFLEYSQYNIEDFGFLDLLLYQLEKEFKNLRRRGLKKSYLSQKKDLTLIRDRINLKRLINRGGISNQKIPCFYFERTENNIFNQIIKAGLKLGINLTTQKYLKQNLIHFYNMLDISIDTIVLNKDKFKKAFNQINRLTRNYRPILELIYILWKRNIPNLYDKCENVRLNGFLFNMNKFFENLLYKLLKANLSGYRIEHWYKFTDMLCYIKEHNPKRKKAITLHPDFVIFRKNRSISVLDAKYRDLWKMSTPIKWLYQLSFYSLNPIAQNKAYIFYPTNSSEAIDARLEVKNPDKDQRISEIILRPLIISNLIDVINSKEQKKLQTFVLELIQ